jgi:transketolase
MECQRPVALVLSRQDVRSLPVADGDVSKGAYVVIDDANPEIVMVASGSEVSTLVEGAELLRAEGVRVRVVSVPSEGLFRDQTPEYQASVLPAGVPRYGLTSGLPVTLAGLVGTDGTVHGLDHFGYSAPYKVLDEKFGFSGRAVYEEVKKVLKK